MKPATPEEKVVIFIFNKYYKNYRNFNAINKEELLMTGLIAIYELQKIEQCYENTQENRFKWICEANRKMCKFWYKNNKNIISLNTPVNDEIKATLEDVVEERENIINNIDYEYLLNKIKQQFKQYKPNEQKYLYYFFNTQSFEKTSKKYNIKICFLSKLVKKFRNELRNNLLNESYILTNPEYENKRNLEYKAMRKRASENYFKRTAKSLNCSVKEYKQKRKNINLAVKNAMAEREQICKQIGYSKSKMYKFLASANKLNLDFISYLKQYIFNTLDNLLFDNKITNEALANLLHLDITAIKKKRVKDGTHFFLYEIVKIKNKYFSNYSLKELVNCSC